MKIKSLNPYLEKYDWTGQFEFSQTDTLDMACNAPKDQGGVYILENKDNNEVIYIGSSGHFYQKEEKFIPRRDGFWGRIVKGKQTLIIDGKDNNDQRRKLWPKKMVKDGIKILRISWVVTHQSGLKHIPAYTEAVLIQKFYEKYGCLPVWNQKF